MSTTMSLEPLRNLLNMLPLNVTPHTVRRWIRVGVALPNGRRAKLQVRKIGNRLYAYPAAVERFLKEIGASEALAALDAEETAAEVAVAEAVAPHKIKRGKK
jgi:hypothetical protein